MVAWAAGCAASDSAFVGNGGDDDDDEPSIGSADCPEVDPEEDAQCTQPEGTTCAVGPCSDRYMACRSGRWARSATSPPVAACPAQAPEPGDSCPRCFPTSVRCAFGCDGEQPAIFGVCNDQGASGGLIWQVSPRECPRFDASAGDADPQDGSQ